MSRADPRNAWSFTTWDLPRDPSKVFLGVRQMGLGGENVRTSTRIIQPPQSVGGLRQGELLEKLRKMMSGEKKRPLPEDRLQSMLQHPPKKILSV